jgi:hypothetical protein
MVDEVCRPFGQRVGGIGAVGDIGIDNGVPIEGVAGDVEEKDKPDRGASVGVGVP